MIGFLSGRVVTRGQDAVLLDVSGVGYRLTCSSSTLAGIPPEGSPCRLWTLLRVREDALVLFGFATEAEQRQFEALMGVQGVGPKAALGLCSAFSPDSFRKVMASEDVAALASVPGIGRKTAQRILIDLRERFAAPDLEAVASKPGAVAQARSALENLGYSPAEVRLALGEVDAGPDDEVEEVVKSALRLLA